MNIFSDIEEVQKSAVVVIKPPTGYDGQRVMAALCKKLPELDENRFHFKKKKDCFEYEPMTKVKIVGDKLIMDKLRILHIEDDQYQIHIEYRTKFFRPFLFLFTVLFLILGILPGIIIWLMFRETESAELKRVRPALIRFQTACADLFDQTSEPDMINQLRGSDQKATDVSSRLNRLEALHSSGALKDDEYEVARARIISSI